MEFLDGTRRGRRRDAVIAGGVLMVSLFLFFMPVGYQTPVRQAIRGSVLQPFLAIQSEVVSREMNGQDVFQVRAERDSLAAVVAAQATLVEENRRLRALLGLRGRAEPSFVAGAVLRIGTPGAESTFLLDVGGNDGVGAGSPVLTAEGLLGVVRDVDRRSSHAIDWANPDFRASAMTVDGGVYGIVEPRRGEFREEDLLALTGAPFHSDISPGTRIVTSGRGGVYPRGIPIGTVLGIEEADTGWRKSYLLRPAVRPAAATHVLVGVQRADENEGDLSPLWNVPESRDTTTPGGQP